MAEPVTYAGYLRLDQLLSAQEPRSAEHDEMLFIVIHQIYELWFKQLLHELARLQAQLEAGETTHATRTLRRTLAILKTVVAQLDVLETMTPTQFTRFRGALGTSSGFESAQFRVQEPEIEAGVVDNERRVAQKLEQRIDHGTERRFVRKKFIGKTVHALRLKRNVPFGIDIGLKALAARQVIEKFDAADLDDAMSVGGIEAGRFRIQHHFTHCCFASPSASEVRRRSSSLARMRVPDLCR